MIHAIALDDRKKAKLKKAWDKAVVNFDKSLYLCENLEEFDESESEHTLSELANSEFDFHPTTIDPKVVNSILFGNYDGLVKTEFCMITPITLGVVNGGDRPGIISGKHRIAALLTLAEVLGYNPGVVKVKVKVKKYKNDFGLSRACISENKGRVVSPTERMMIGLYQGASINDAQIHKTKKDRKTYFKTRVIAHLVKVGVINRKTVSLNVAGHILNYLFDSIYEKNKDKIVRLYKENDQAYWKEVLEVLGKNTELALRSERGIYRNKTAMVNRASLWYAKFDPSKPIEVQREVKIEIPKVHIDLSPRPTKEAAEEIHKGVYPYTHLPVKAIADFKDGYIYWKPAKKPNKFNIKETLMYTEAVEIDGVLYPTREDYDKGVEKGEVWDTQVKAYLDAMKDPEFFNMIPPQTMFNYIPGDREGKYLEYFLKEILGNKTDEELTNYWVSHYDHLKEMFPKTPMEITYRDRVKSSKLRVLSKNLQPVREYKIANKFIKGEMYRAISEKYGKMRV